MELIVEQYSLPEKIQFNFEELKQAIVSKTKDYEGLVYTEDKIKEAKSDKSELNKLKKALNDERIRREKEYLIPFNEFKSQMNELVGILDSAILQIDVQIKESDDKRKAEKLEYIKKLWETIDHPEDITFDHVFKDKMLNVSFNMRHVKQSFEDYVMRYNLDMDALRNIPEYSFEAIEYYKQTHSLNDAMAKAREMVEIRKRKEAEEARKKELELERAKQEEERIKLESENIPPVQEHAQDQYQPQEQSADKKLEEKKLVRFEAMLTMTEAVELRDYFLSKGIKFRTV